jgi:hypothetical protein
MLRCRYPVVVWVICLVGGAVGFALARVPLKDLLVLMLWT